MIAEGKRIFWQRKMLLFILCLLIGNFLLFLGIQIKNSDMGNVFSYRARKEKLLGTDRGLLEENIGEKLIKIQQKRAKEKKETEAEMTADQILLSYLNTYEYQLSYRDKLAAIYHEADEMSDIGIFSEKDSFSYQNLQKTKKDYEKLEKTVLSMGEDKVVNSVLEYSWCPILLLLFGMGIVGSLLEERRNHMHQVVITSAGGRAKLAFWRCILLLASIGIMGFLLLMETILEAVFLYGIDVGWNRSIQSVMCLQNCTIPVTIAVFFLLFYLFMVLGSISICLIVWCWLKVSGNWKLSILCMSVFAGVEYLIYRYVSANSSWGILKHINIFSALLLKSNFTQYCNVSIGIGLIEKGKLLCFTELVVSLLGMCIGVILGARQRLLKTAEWQNGIKKKVIIVLDKVGFFTVHNLELYRILILKKGILVCVLAGGAMLFLSVQHKVYYTQNQAQMNRFCQNYGGAMTEEFYRASEEVKKRADKIENNWKAIEDAHKNENLSDKDYEMAKMEYEQQASEIMLANDISSKIQRLEKTQKKTKGNVWFINERGYEKLLGNSGKTRHYMRNVIIFLSIVILMSGLCFEGKQKGMHLAVSASVNGRLYLFWKKARVCVFIAVLTSIIVYGAELYCIQSVYPLYCLNAPVQSVEILQNFPVHCPIWCYLIFYYGARIIGWCVLGMVIFTTERFGIQKENMS